MYVCIYRHSLHIPKYILTHSFRSDPFNLFDSNSSLLIAQLDRATVDWTVVCESVCAKHGRSASKDIPNECRLDSCV